MNWLNHLIIGTIVTLALTSTLACGDECTEGERRCDGEHIASCGRGGDISGTRSFSAWVFECGKDRCVDIVVDGLRSAVCSKTGELDPRCAGVAGVMSRICADPTTVLVCQSGYGSSEEICAGKCAVGERGPACVAP